MPQTLGTDYIVDIIEATIRVLINMGFTRDQAIQVMLSQLAVQTEPKTMEMAVRVSKKYADAFDASL